MDEHQNEIAHPADVLDPKKSGVAFIRVGWGLGVRASYSLLGLISLSYIAWLLFTTAQSTSKAGPTDHRDIDSWIACTVLFLFAWLISAIFEYRLMRTMGIRVGK
jgi:hypothetical protein